VMKRSRTRTPKTRYETPSTEDLALVSCGPHDSHALHGSCFRRLIEQPSVPLKLLLMLPPMQQVPLLWLAIESRLPLRGCCLAKDPW